MYNTIDEIRADPMLKHIDKLLFNTNLHGGFIEYEKDKGFVDSGIYFVASISPISELNLENKNPADIQSKIAGDCKIFYPYEYVIKITDQDPLIVFDKISEYCRNAEMLNVYFGLENVPVPREMPVGDLVNLRQAVMNSRNTNISEEMRAAVAESMKKGIRQYADETKKNERIAAAKAKHKTKAEEINDFLRESKWVGIEVIDDRCLDDLVYFLNKKNPNLKYIVSDKITVNTGIEEAKKGDYDPYGYAARNHAYREIYYKRADEHVFQDAFNSIKFSRTYGKGNDISLVELAQHGPVCSIQIPANYMWLVDKCLTKWGVKYSIDYGYLNQSENSNTVPLLYLEKDKNIINGMAKDLCNRYAGESYVHTYDKNCFYEKQKKAENKKKRGFGFEK